MSSKLPFKSSRAKAVQGALRAFKSVQGLKPFKSLAAVQERLRAKAVQEALRPFKSSRGLAAVQELRSSNNQQRCRQKAYEEDCFIHDRPAGPVFYRQRQERYQR